MANQVPLVGYLALGASPHLVANTCESCGARYFDRRNACAHCGGRTFTQKPVATTGKVRTFTIVERAAPGIKTPFVSAVIDLDDGARVQTNVVDVEPTPEHVSLGMKVKLKTYVVGTDDNGTEAVAFGFAPV